MKSYIREAGKEKEEFRDFGQVDFEDHEIEMIKKQCEKTNEQLEGLGI